MQKLIEKLEEIWLYTLEKYEIYYNSSSEEAHEEYQKANALYCSLIEEFEKLKKNQ